MSKSVSRVLNAYCKEKICTAQEAVSIITNGDIVGMSGFTGAGYPKKVPQALAAHAQHCHAEGQDFAVSILSGASTGPELDGVLAAADAIAYRAPYNSDKTLRQKINQGTVPYADIHLSRMAPLAALDIQGAMDVAVIEVSAIKANGKLVPSSSIGNNQAWLDRAKKVILEVNDWQSAHFEGLHDIYRPAQFGTTHEPIPLREVNECIGSSFLEVDLQKVQAVVLSSEPDRNALFSAPDDTARAIASHLLDFFTLEVKKGRLPEQLYPLQSGVGNIANAVLAGLKDGPFRKLEAFTEVIQDGMIELLEAGIMSHASATAFSLSPQVAHSLNQKLDSFKGRIVLRPQEISNHAELIRRLHCIAMNGMLEADIYGSVNSTHVMGSAIQNGIGGSGDFARNAFLSIFMTPSTAKGGKISAIVPALAHVDHISQDVHVMVTEQGLADLRGLAPRQRAEKIISVCAHPDYRPALREYYQQACATSFGGHKPQSLTQAFSWHQRYIETGSMRVE